MRTIEDYIDLAMKETGSKSLRQLASHVGKTVASLCEFRKGRALPANPTMEKIAELANIPTEEALRDLEIWRARRFEARALRMLQQARKRTAAVVAAVALAAVIVPSWPTQGTAGEQINRPYSPLYIMGILWRRFFRPRRMLAPL